MSGMVGTVLYGWYSHRMEYRTDTSAVEHSLQIS